MPVELRGLLADIADEARALADRPLAPDDVTILRQLIELLPVPAFVADNTGRHVLVNAAACEMTGYDDRELCQLSVVDLTRLPPDANGYLLWQDFLEEVEQFGDYTIVTKDGRALATVHAARPHVFPGLHLALIGVRPDL